MVDDLAEKQYSAFMVNRGLSYFPDTVLLANEMNVNHHSNARLQFDFLRETVRKKKRFSKWVKATEHEDLEMLKRKYGYSNEKARYALSLLTKSQLEIIRASIFRGGSKPSKA